MKHDKLFDEDGNLKRRKTKKQKIKEQLEKDVEEVRRKLGVDFELVWEPDWEKANYQPPKNEVHIGTANGSIENLAMARLTLVHEAIHAGGLHHNAATRRHLGYYSSRTEDTYTPEVMRHSLGWEPPTREELVDNYNKHAKYVVRCKECGTEGHWHSRTRVVRRPDLYHCGKCGGPLESEEVA